MEGAFGGPAKICRQSIFHQYQCHRRRATSHSRLKTLSKDQPPFARHFFFMPAFARSSLLFLIACLSAAHAQPATTPLFWPDKNGPTYDGIVPANEAARLPL